MKRQNGPETVFSPGKFHDNKLWEAFSLQDTLLSSRKLLVCVYERERVCVCERECVCACVCTVCL